ncbi:MAG: T9SS type A sorting domain-containing protein [Flavobacteriales bacterium]
MKLSISVFSLLFSFQFLAQITITVADHANANDTVRYSQAVVVPLDLQATGPNSTWDFSQLVAQTQTLKNFAPLDFSSFLIIATYGPIASTPYRASYHNPSTALPIDQFSAFLPIELSNLTQYSKRTTNAITSIGYSIDVQGQGLPFKSDTIETRYELPLQFNDTYNSRGYTYVDLNPAADIKFIQHRQRNSVVDGWGTLITPHGTFPALRIRHDITETDSIYQTFFGQGAWIAPPTFQTTEYEWWGNGKKDCLLKIIEGGFGQQGQAITSIEYQDEYLGLDANVSELDEQFYIAPNPCTDLLFFQTPVSLSQIELFNALGQKIQTFTNESLVGYLDLSGLPSGSYTLVLHSAHLQFVRKLVKL